MRPSDLEATGQDAARRRATASARPYSAVVTWPDGFALRHHHCRLGAEMAVCVDLHLDPAIGEDALGDDGHQIDALDLLGDDEGGRALKSG